MKVCGLIALKDFNTYDASGRVVAVKYEPLPPLYYSTAKRLIKDGYAARRRTKKITGETKDG